LTGRVGLRSAPGWGDPIAKERARQLRTNSTNAERKLWRFLRTLKPHGFHFRRQVPIDHLIVDFACYSARVVIEVDGGQHNMPTGQHLDAARDRFLRENDFRVLRFCNNDVLRNTDGVAHEIYIALGLARDTPTPIPSPQGGGE
jgi:very-short-patch-repair endonuclease